MANSVISQSETLAKQRKKYRRRAVFLSLFYAFLFFLLFALYVLLAAFGHGYYGLSAPFGAIDALSVLPYFDLSVSPFDFSTPTALFRWGMVLAALLVSVLIYLLTHAIYIRRYGRRYLELYERLVGEETRILGLSLDILPLFTEQDQESLEEDIGIFGLAEVKGEKAYQFSTPLLSWKGIQVRYSRDGKRRDGFFLSCDLSKAKSRALIQLRTYGSFERKQYDGLPVHAYGFADVPSLSPFTCYSTLGQDIYLVFDKRTADAISAFYSFVSSDLILNVVGEKLSVFVDGFRLKLTHPLKEKVPPSVLEKEAEALTAFHRYVSNIALALSGEMGESKDNKGNGIVSD